VIVSELADIARHLNRVARSLVEEDGAHEPMYFLLVEGRVEPHLFGPADRPVGEARAAELAEAVRATGADAVVVVSEAWAAPADAVPPGSGAGDAPGATDVLIVAGVDRAGNQVAFETALQRGTDGILELGETHEYDASYNLFVLDAVREVWRAE
jgi:hypothetical protein